MKFISDVKLLLKITQEYVNAQFTIAFSAIFSLLFLLYSFNFSEGIWRPYVVGFFAIYLGTTIYVWLTSLLIKKDLAKNRELTKRTRLLGIPLILTIFVGMYLLPDSVLCSHRKIKRQNTHLLFMLL